MSGSENDLFKFKKNNGEMKNEDISDVLMTFFKILIGKLIFKNEIKQLK